jgi:hypothetical protein
VVESHSVLAQEVVKRNLMSVKELGFPVSVVSALHTGLLQIALCMCQVIMNNQSLSMRPVP